MNSEQWPPDQDIETIHISANDYYHNARKEVALRRGGGGRGKKGKEGQRIQRVLNLRQKNE